MLLSLMMLWSRPCWAGEGPTAEQLGRVVWPLWGRVVGCSVRKGMSPQEVAGVVGRFAPVYAFDTEPGKPNYLTAVYRELRLAVAYADEAGLRVARVRFLPSELPPTRAEWMGARRIGQVIWPLWGRLLGCFLKKGTPMQEADRFLGGHASGCFFTTGRGPNWWVTQYYDLRLVVTYKGPGIAFRLDEVKFLDLIPPPPSEPGFWEVAFRRVWFVWGRLVGRFVREGMSLDEANAVVGCRPDEVEVADLGRPACRAVYRERRLLITYLLDRSVLRVHGVTFLPLEEPRPLGSDVALAEARR